jgi:peptidoglycan/xylan/chitin deacetylase (PgdA/CDA1 family)
MVRAFKLLVLRTLKGAGLFGLAAKSKWRRERLLILCYHGVSLEDEHLWNPDLYMAPGQFAGRMRLLEQAKCNVLPLGEALERLYARDLPERSVVLTFDDGFYDFSARVFPILQEHRFPATVYLSTYYCDRAYPVFSVASNYLLWKNRGKTVPRDAGFETDLDLRDAHSRGRTLQALSAFCEERGLSGEEKNDLLRKVACRLEFDFERFTTSRILQLLTPAETAQLSAAGIDFELHTHRHCTPSDSACFRAEVEDNRARLSAMTGVVPKHFCYPSGVVQSRFLPWLKESGVVSATTCERGFARPATMPLLLPRGIDVSGATELEFESWLCGVGALVSRQVFGLRSPDHLAAAQI